MSSSEATKAKMIDAALETLRESGIVGASARTIAQRGGFSQAAIFYHYGSVHELLLASVRALSAKRMDRYAARLEGVSTLQELVVVATELHAEDDREGHISVLSQMLAGASAAPEIRSQLLELFTPWLQLVEDVIERVVAGTPYAASVPVRDLSFGVVAMFVGVELLSSLEGGAERTEGLFETAQMAALLLGGLLGPGATADTPPSSLPS